MLEILRTGLFSLILAYALCTCDYEITMVIDTFELRPPLEVYQESKQTSALQWPLWLVNRGEGGVMSGKGEGVCAYKIAPFLSCFH
jgi:hypothetical protein